MCKGMRLGQILMTFLMCGFFVVAFGTPAAVAQVPPTGPVSDLKKRTMMVEKSMAYRDTPATFTVEYRPHTGHRYMKGDLPSRKSPLIQEEEEVREVRDDKPLCIC